jgi:hypothetical protein
MLNGKAVGSFALLTVVVALSGCMHKDAPPQTPSENTATPTYRSTVNSYEMNTAPKYTQSGNGGEPATLPAIPSPARFSQNTPLANAVYSSIPSVESKYIVVASKGSTVKLTGTVTKAELPSVLADAIKPTGVKQVDVSQLEVK